MTQELKPCPFCGGDVVLIDVGNFLGGSYWKPSCLEDCCILNCGVISQDHAVTIWNSRTDTTQSAEIAALKAKLAEAVEALEKAASRFWHCADMIAMGFNASGTLRAEREIKARHYAHETRAAAAQVVAKHGVGR